MTNLTADFLLTELKKLARPDKTAVLLSFFQCLPGGYGEGDQFLGVIVPDQRKIAKAFREMPLKELSLALRSPWHESRLTALFVLVHHFEKSKASLRATLYEFYLEHLNYVDNWDLVDSSARHIVGEYVLEHTEQRRDLFALASSDQLWRQRVAVVATHALINKHEFLEIKKLAKLFLKHPHDLIHKAVGWMLREMGQVNELQLVRFLEQNAKKMPRTMLRYAIEKLSKEERMKFMER
jgi:3-methyladenine DNA glycosylase AlkD